MFGRRNPHDEYDERYARRPVRERREGPFLWLHLAILAVLAGGGVFCVYAISGERQGEQTLKALATPVGLIWLFLIGQVYLGCVYRRSGLALAGMIVWAGLTLGGNQLICEVLYRSLENPYFEFQSGELEPFDAIVVLGGGTTVTPAGEAQLSASGDRVMLAARLFHSGKTARLIVSGQQTVRTTELDLEPGQEAQQLLTQVGVPLERMTLLTGHQTQEEIQALRAWVDAQASETPLRLGLVTSAWHMRRAMGLAEAAGLQLVPLPADFQSGPYIPGPGLVIPSGGNLNLTGRALHEWLGRWIGR